MTGQRLHRFFLVDSIETYNENTDLQANWQQGGGSTGSDYPVIDVSTPFRGFQSLKIINARPGGDVYLNLALEELDAGDYTHLYFASKAAGQTTGSVRIYDIHSNYDEYSASYTTYWSAQSIELNHQNIDPTAVQNIWFSCETNSTNYLDDVGFLAYGDADECVDWIALKTMRIKADEPINSGGVEVMGRHGKNNTMGSSPGGTYELEVFMRPADIAEEVQFLRDLKNAGQCLILRTDQINRPCFITNINEDYVGGKDLAFVKLKISLREYTKAGWVHYG